MASSFLPSGLDLGRTSVVTTSSVAERSVFPGIIILTSLSDNDEMEEYFEKDVKSEVESDAEFDDM